MPGRKPKVLEGVNYIPEFESLCQKIASSSFSTSEVNPNDADTFIVRKALAPMPITEAKKVINDIDWSDVKKKSVFPLIAVKALRSLVIQSNESKLLSDLESAMAKTSLSFTKNDSNEDDEERKKYLERIRMLRLRKEEREYSKLTSNIDTKVTEDAGTRSMTYAASIGLNMIVAPLSFGCFCYFFSGNLFSWIDGYLEKEPDDSDNVDIRRVIIGVIAGVAMMFIEMILFVIRSHALEQSFIKKEKKKDVTPFGYDRNSKHNERTFTGNVYG